RGGRWRWITPGSLLTTVLWLVASAGFSLYVARFGSYNETYGSLGAVVVLLMWLWISAYLVLLGAELDATLERTSRADDARRARGPGGGRGRYAEAAGPRR